MAAHQFHVASEQFGHAARDELMRCAVESVLGHALFAPRGRHAIVAGVFGHGAVEFGFEGRHDGHAGHGFLQRFDGSQIDGVVRGSGRQVVEQCCFHAGIHYERAAILGTGVDGFEHDRVNLRRARRDLRHGFPIIRDALHAPLRDDGLGGHFQNLIFEGSRSQVGYE